TKNILHCLNYETQMGWLIDPEEQTVFVYIRNQQPVMLDELEALLPVPDFASELRLTVGDLFGWLLE
ncbi:MAG: Uma2 family endonuclease, partial [Nostoc sp.]